MALKDESDPLVCELDTAAQPQPVPHLGAAKSTLSHNQGLTLVPSLERQDHIAMAAQSFVSTRNNSKIPKITLDMTTGSPPLDIRNAVCVGGRECECVEYICTHCENIYSDVTMMKIGDFE